MGERCRRRCGVGEVVEVGDGIGCENTSRRKGLRKVRDKEARDKKAGTLKVQPQFQKQRLLQVLLLNLVGMISDILISSIQSY